MDPALAVDVDALTAQARACLAARRGCPKARVLVDPLCRAVRGLEDEQQEVVQLVLAAWLVHSARLVLDDIGCSTRPRHRRRHFLVDFFDGCYLASRLHGTMRDAVRGAVWRILDVDMGGGCTKADAGRTVRGVVRVLLTSRRASNASRWGKAYPLDKALGQVVALRRRAHNHLARRKWLLDGIAAVAVPLTDVREWVLEGVTSYLTVFTECAAPLDGVVHMVLAEFLGCTISALLWEFGFGGAMRPLQVSDLPPCPATSFVLCMTFHTKSGWPTRAEDGRWAGTWLRDLVHMGHSIGNRDQTEAWRLACQLMLQACSDRAMADAILCAGLEDHLQPHLVRWSFLRYCCFFFYGTMAAWAPGSVRDVRWLLPYSREWKVAYPQTWRALWDSARLCARWQAPRRKWCSMWCV